MTSPPGLHSVAGARLIQQGEKPQGMTPAQRVSSLIKEARRYRQLDSVSNTRLSTLVNAYVSTEIERDFVSWVIGYADPTGETAVHNVLRQQRRAS